MNKKNILLAMRFPPKIDNMNYPICKDCKYFLQYKSDIQLSRCMFYGKKDLITGTVVYKFADLVRSDDQKCGIKGDYFEAKTVIPSPDETKK